MFLGVGKLSGFYFSEVGSHWIELFYNLREVFRLPSDFDFSASVPQVLLFLVLDNVLRPSLFYVAIGVLLPAEKRNAVFFDQAGELGHELRNTFGRAYLEHHVAEAFGVRRIGRIYDFEERDRQRGFGEPSDLYAEFEDDLP
jgi:hypothetical protein